MLSNIFVPTNFLRQENYSIFLIWSCLSGTYCPCILDMYFVTCYSSKPYLRTRVNGQILCCIFDMCFPGHYIYIDPQSKAGSNSGSSTTPRLARITSTEFPPAPEYCVKFWYTLYGSNTGNLKVYAQVNLRKSSLRYISDTGINLDLVDRGACVQKK